MPLIQGKSKKSFEKNVKTEMEAHPGKENRAQNLAIAYSVQRKNKKKKMAYGGKAEDTNEPPMPAKKPDDHRLPEDEYMASNTKMLAYGGKAEEDGEPAMPKKKKSPMGPSEDEYMASNTKMLADGGQVPNPKSDPAPGGPKVDLDKAAKIRQGMNSVFAKGGAVEDTEMEDDKMHYDGIADAILAKRKKAKMMAEGGEAKDDEMSDLDNEEEGSSPYDDMNSDAVGELYDEDYASEPEDSNETGDEEEKDSENEHDMISSIRKKIKKKVS